MAVLFFFFSVVVVVFLLLLHVTAIPTTIAALELSVLLELKAALHISDASPQFKSWTPSTPPCNYSFISCSPSGNITSIDLTSTDRYGSIPFESLCNLPALTRLSVGSNRLEGPVSPAVRNCIALRHLDLGSNHLSGTLPDLSPLINLRVLNLSDNAFTGPIPSLRSLTALEHLLLGDNSFDSSPFPPQILELRNLTWLYLSNCSITGRIPSGIGNLTRLINLELADNNLHGEIPMEISRLTDLWQLELYDNALVGTLPIGLGNLSKLAYFDASSNLLEGGLGEVRQLKSLISLQLFENNFSGPVPAELGDFPSLVNLSLYSNRLTGELPPSLGSSAEFDFIDVSTNFFTGPIPPDMCRRGTMRMLLMLENQFTGSIPSGYGECRTLTRFRVSDNRLNGSVPSGLWSLPEIRIIDLAKNEITGPIEDEIRNARVLTQLLLSRNRFTGSIPKGIGRADGLVGVDLSNNQFSGEMPREIGDLRQLNSLHLQNNVLSGAIPPEIGLCVALNDLDTSSNRIEGEIPPSLGKLPVLNSLNLSNNLLMGEIPDSLSSLRLSSLDLSNNQLAGEVPTRLAVAAYAGSFTGNPGLCAHAAFLPPCGSGSGDRTRGVIAGVLIGVGSVLAAIGVGLFVRRRKGKVVGDARATWTVRSFRFLELDDREIGQALREENLIGKGASGSVYRVKLGSGAIVAVKHVMEGHAMKQLQAEVEVLSEIRHANVVKLYCSLTGKGGSLLVYEYLPNGSLWQRLHEEGDGLPWKKRYEVALGVAKGLEYLHHGYTRAIVHRDVKSSNILLDGDFRARIADFGLAREMEEEPSRVVAGTHGYICPEYAYTYKVTEKSDVYSFGVVLMELVTGRRPIEPDFGESKHIVHWICKKMASKEDVVCILDPVIPKELQGEAMDVLETSIHCTMKLPSLRPSMKRVVQMLEDAGKWRLRTCHVGEMEMEIK